MKAGLILLRCSTAPAAIAAPCYTAADGPEFGLSFILSEPKRTIRALEDPRRQLVLVPELAPELPEGITGIWVDEWADIEAAAFGTRLIGAPIGGSMADAGGALTLDKLKAAKRALEEADTISRRRWAELAKLSADELDGLRPLPAAGNNWFRDLYLNAWPPRPWEFPF